MLSKFIKKSVASKFFIMNLIILICIVTSQLIFQALYFEKYYIDKKQQKLERAINEFKGKLNITNNKEELIAFMQNIKREEGIALAYRNVNLFDGISLESYMGEKAVIITDKTTKKKFKVILGSQYPKELLKKGDRIEARGSIDDYGYLFAEDVAVNGIYIEPYYNIIPTETLEPAIIVKESVPLTIEEKNIVYVEGIVEELIQEDNTYSILSNLDLYLPVEEKMSIYLNDKYVVKTNTSNSINDILVCSNKALDGYIIAITNLTEVNDIFGTMNSYYLITFIVVFLIVIIISLIYSRYITRPLIEMSNIARRISQCDFQYKYDVKSEDEIGILGNSLNSISNNLEKSLNELQDVNEKLKKEMDIKKLQEENRKELIANISHELKTPITIVQGTINGIKSGIYTEDMYEDILEETNKMNELVKEMLEISKLESPTFVLNKEAFDLGGIFLKEKDKLKSMIMQKNITVNYNDFDEVVVFGDEKRINQVVINLLTNAIKYTPDNGKVDVSIELDETENNYVFSIENFGVLLTEEEIEKIWEPFYRKEKSRNKKFGGTGLGLYIVKKILEVHNCNYGVENKDNSVKFYFNISKCMAY